MGTHRSSALAVGALLLCGAAGCTSLLGADGRYEEEGSTGEGRGGAGPAGSTGTATPSATSGSDTTTSATSTGGAGGSGGDSCAEDFAAGSVVTGAGGGGEGGCDLIGTPTDCMACGHDCGPGSTCLEHFDRGFRCRAERVGAPADTVQAIAMGGGLIHTLQAPGNAAAFYRLPILATDVETPSPGTESPCEALADCAYRRVVAAENGAVYVGTPSKGVFECRPNQPCASFPSVGAVEVTGLSLGPGGLYFLRPTGGADLQVLDPDSRQTESVGDVPSAMGALSLVGRGPDWFWSTVALQGAPNGGLVKLGGSVPSTLPAASGASPTTVASDGNSLFWRAGGTIFKLTSGCTPEPLYQAVAPETSFLEVDSTFVYFDALTDGSRVYRCPKEVAQGAPVPATDPVCDELSPGGAYASLAADALWVVFGSGNQVYRVRKAP